MISGILIFILEFSPLGGVLEDVEDVEAVVSSIVSVVTLIGSSQIRPDEPGLRNDTVDLCNDACMIAALFDLSFSIIFNTLF